MIAATVVSATTGAGSKRARAAGLDARLKITETFVSIQGEADAVGWPTFFIRLTGCPLRCVYCDTAYAFYGGAWRTVGSLLEAARESGVRRVCVTGGEPLAQKSCLDLLAFLCEAGFAVSLETSGAIDIGEVDPRVSRVVDIKTPDSGESPRNRMDNMRKLTSRDQVKIVICSRPDYEWARDFVLRHPISAARLALLKIGYLFGVEGREHAWGYSHHLQGRRSPRTVRNWGIALIVSFPLLMTLASVGLWRPGLALSAAGVLALATLITVTVIHVATFGDTRFHLPWVPLLAILAARAFAPLDARPWTLARQTLLAMWLVVFALVWRDQAAELMAVLPKLAESPVPLALPY